MTKLFAHLRIIVGALAFICAVGLMMPASAQQPNSVNPNAAAVKEQQLLQELQRIQGRGTIPDTKSYVLEQPEGREWRQWHEVTLRWITGIVILGILALLVIFYLVRGMLIIKS